MTTKKYTSIIADLASALLWASRGTRRTTSLQRQSFLRAMMLAGSSAK